MLILARSFAISGKVSSGFFLAKGILALLFAEIVQELFQSAFVSFGERGELFYYMQFIVWNGFVTLWQVCSPGEIIHTDIRSSLKHFRKEHPP